MCRIFRLPPSEPIFSNPRRCQSCLPSQRLFCWTLPSVRPNSPPPPATPSLCRPTDTILLRVHAQRASAKMRYQRPKCACPCRRGRAKPSLRAMTGRLRFPSQSPRRCVSCRRLATHNATRHWECVRENPPDRLNQARCSCGKRGSKFLQNQYVAFLDGVRWAGRFFRLLSKAV